MVDALVSRHHGGAYSSGEQEGGTAHERTQEAPMTTPTPPMYHRIAAMLSSRIRTGYYPPGSLLGTEKELAESFGVSRVTIRQAFQILSKQNLILRKQARGTFVSPDLELRDVVELNGLLDDILLQADTGKTAFVERESAVATLDVAERLRIAEGEPVEVVRRLRTTHSEPMMPKGWLINYLPESVGAIFSDADLQNSSLLQLLDQEPRTHLSWGHQDINADGADDETARRLEIEPGSPVLKVERVVYSDDGTPMEYVIIKYAPGQFTYDVQLDRMQR